MIDGDVIVLFEGNAVQAVCQSEDAVDDLRQFEIGSQHLGIDIVFLQLKLVRIEAEVPRLEFEVLAFRLLCHLLNGSHLFHGRRLVSDDQVVEQFIDIAHIACHAMFQHVVGIGLVTQQLCQFATEVDQALTNVEVVLAIIVDTLRVLGHIHLTAQVALRGIGHEGRVRGEVEGEHPTLLVHLLGRQGCCLTGCRRQTVELRLIGDMKREGFVLLQEIL